VVELTGDQARAQALAALARSALCGQGIFSGSMDIETTFYDHAPPWLLRRMALT